MVLDNDCLMIKGLNHHYHCHHFYLGTSLILLSKEPFPFPTFLQKYAEGWYAGGDFLLQDFHMAIVQNFWSLPLIHWGPTFVEGSDLKTRTILMWDSQMQKFCWHIVDETSFLPKGIIDIMFTKTAKISYLLLDKLSIKGA